jgi:hypothetical protein
MASLQPASVAAARPAAANATINGRAPVIREYKFFMLIPFMLKIAIQGQHRAFRRKAWTKRYPPCRTGTLSGRRAIGSNGAGQVGGGGGPSRPAMKLAISPSAWTWHAHWLRASGAPELMSLFAGGGLDGGNSETAHGVTLSSGG